MEVTHNPLSVLEEFIMSSSPFHNETLSNPWNNFTCFDHTQDLVSPLPNPELTTHLWSLGDSQFQHFLDGCLTSPANAYFFEDEPSPNQTDMGIQQMVFLDNVTSQYGDGFGNYKIDDSIKMSRSTGAEISRSKKPDGHTSKNLMAERRRRKRLNDRLSMLRSIVPKISKMDRTSILGDTIHYLRELHEKIHRLREEGLDMDESIKHLNLISNQSDEPMLNDLITRRPSKFDVNRENEDTQIQVCCNAKPGLLMSTLTTLDALGLDVHQCVISCFNEFSFQASCHQVTENEYFPSCEDIKQALFVNSGYGGRCP